MKVSDLRRKRLIDEAIMKHNGEPALWFMDKCNIDLRPTQVIHIDEIRKHPWILDLAPPRFGKTYEAQLAGLMDASCNPWEDIAIWGPKEARAKDALQVQTDAIEGSPILRKYIAHKSGKRLLSSTGYTFLNGSNARIFGIYGNFEGINATVIYVEEADDVDIEIFNTRVLQRGAGVNRNGLPLRIRITGTIQEGKGNIFTFHEDPKYHNLLKWDVTVGLRYGYYDLDYILSQKETLTEDDFLRIWMLVFTESKNFIHEKWLMNAKRSGLKYGYDIQDPYDHDFQHKQQGMVFAGLDMGASGESKKASEYVATFIEVIGEKIVWLGGASWRPTENSDTVKEEFCQLWEKYHCQYGMGDALKADMVRDINQTLYARRLIRTNVDLFQQNSETTWPEWDFSPVWNTGKFKYLHGYPLQKDFELGKIIFPYADIKDDRPIAEFLKKTFSVLKNIKESKKSPSQKYPSLVAINKILGDDHYDSLVMAKASAMTRFSPPVDYSKLKRHGRRKMKRPSMASEIKKDSYFVDKDKF